MSTQEGFSEEWTFRPDLKDEEDYTPVTGMAVGSWVRTRGVGCEEESQCCEDRGGMQGELG